MPDPETVPEELLDEWCAFVAAAMNEESGGGATAAGLRVPGPDTLRWVVVDGGRVIGAAQSTPDRDDRFVRIYVAEANRRRGVGTALLAAVRAAHPSGGLQPAGLKGITIEGRPGERFAAHHGATVLMRLLVMEQRLASVPAHPVVSGTTIWVDGAPDELLGSYVAAYRSLADAPGSAHQLDGADWDPERIRRWEAEVRDAGRELWVAAIVRDGQVVAFTEVEAGGEAAGSQHNTVVLPAYRRRGFGLGVKLALAGRLRAERPHLETVSTTVAAGNTPMIAVNERAGYDVVRIRLMVRMRQPG